MKQKLLLLIVASSLFAACLKDGDLDRFRHDMVIEADISPEVGLPLGKAEVTIADLLGMFKNSQAKITIDNRGLVTLYYDTVITASVDFRGNNHKGTTSAKGAYTKYQEQMTGNLDIDLFKNLSHMPGGDSLMIDQAYAYMLSQIVATANPRTDNLIANHGVKMYFNTIRLFARCADGGNVEIPIHQIDSIPVRNLSHQADSSDLYLIMDSTDIADLINRRPDRLTYSMLLNIDVPTSELSANPSMAVFIRDSLGLSAMDVNAHFKMDVPCILYANGLEFTTNIDWSASNELKELTLDTSYILIDIDNKLPFEFRLECSILDQDSAVVGYLFNGSDAIVSSARIARADLTSYVVSSPVHSVVRIPLDSHKMDVLKQASTLRLRSVIQTSPSESGKPMVGIRSRDAMAFRLSGVFKPHFHQEIDLSGNSDGEGGDK